MEELIPDELALLHRLWGGGGARIEMLYMQGCGMPIQTLVERGYVGKNEESFWLSAKGALVLREYEKFLRLVAAL